MRCIPTGLLLALTTLSTSAQIRIAGRITDNQGKSIEYVNIGIPNSTVSVISDSEGYFSIHVPDSLTMQNLMFSHISHNPQSIPVAELARRETVVIRLPESSRVIPQVVIHSGRERYRRVGGSGVRVPGTSWLLFTDVPGKNIESMAELGTALHIRRPLLIEQVGFPVESCSDSILLRVNLYQIDGDRLSTPLHRVPFYLLLEPSRQNRTYTLDVSSVPIVARPGNILVVFEQADDYGKDIRVDIPFYFGESLYRRGKLQPEFAKIGLPFHIGLQIYGRVVPQ